MNSFRVTGHRKLAGLLLNIFGILLMVWLLWRDSVKADYLAIWKIVLPDWWWNFGLLMLSTAASYTYLKPAGRTGYVEKILRSKWWFASVFTITIGFLFFCSKDKCANLVEIGQDLATVTSLFQLVAIAWITSQRK